MNARQRKKNETYTCIHYEAENGKYFCKINKHAKFDTEEAEAHFFGTCPYCRNFKIAKDRELKQHKKWVRKFYNEMNFALNRHLPIF